MVARRFAGAEPRGVTPGTEGLFHLRCRPHNLHLTECWMPLRSRADISEKLGPATSALSGFVQGQQGGPLLPHIYVCVLLALCLLYYLVYIPARAARFVTTGR